MWQKRRSRADNVSVIVAFLDDEFGAPEPGTEQRAAEADTESDTEAVDAEEFPDETPQESSEGGDMKLCRQLSFRSETNPLKISSPPSELVPAVPLTNDAIEVCSLGKRKNDDTSCSSNQQKKVKTLPDGVCTVVTDLSSESLCDLQLDDELGFADDESDEINNVMDTSRVDKLPCKEVS